MPKKLTAEIIQAAILGFETQKQRIDSEIAALRALLSGGPVEADAEPEAAPRKRRKISAAGLRRMRAAQQRRWAKVRGEDAEAAAEATPEKPKRKLSAKGRRAIVEATKRRWARVRAAAGQREKASKKTARKKSGVRKSARRKSVPAPGQPIA